MQGEIRKGWQQRMRLPGRQTNQQGIVELVRWINEPLKNETVRDKEILAYIAISHPNPYMPEITVR
jgi:hypothetical protein